MEANDQTDTACRPPLREAIVAAKAGNKLLARLALESADGSQHDHVDYWLWQAWTSDSPAGAILALQRVLSQDPDHELARHGLAWAEGLDSFYVDDAVELTGPEETIEPLAEYQPPLEHEPGCDQANELPYNDASEDGVFEDSIAQDVEATQHELDEFLSEACLPQDSSDTEDVPELQTSSSETQSGEPASFDGAEVDECRANSELIGDDDDDDDDELPQSADDEESLAPAPLPEPKASMTILAVDDSPTIRKLLSMSLEKHGYEVVTAFDGMDAINHISSCNPALVLLDINMPRLDGYQLCKLIKNHEKTRMIPVIMLSGKDGMFDKIRGRLVGCDDYITKPFETAELLRKVSNYVTAPVVGDS